MSWPVESPLIEGLLALGFDRQSASRLVRRYPRKQVALWIDINQAAMERFGRQHFRKESSEFSVASFEVERAAVEVVGEGDVILTEFVLHLSPFIFRQQSEPIQKSWRKMEGGK